MYEENKKFELEIDGSTYSVIKEISEQYNFEQEEVLDYVMERALEDFVLAYHEMKNGYLEMAKINLEISNEFAVSEHEVLAYIE